MFMPPRPRQRLYGSPGNYAVLARDLVAGGLRHDDAVPALEKRIAAAVGSRHAIAMPRARVGIYLLLRSLIEPGQEVILSPYTIYDVVNMVIAAGGLPVFADIERGSSNIDADRVDALIGERTGAVLVTHLHGLICDVERIAALCHARNLPLIEDAAQAFGAKRDGRSAGTFGKAGVFSFGMAKNVNCLYGGMVVTDDEALNDRLRREIADWPFMDRRAVLTRAAFCLVGDGMTSPPVFWTATYWLFRYGYLNDIEALNKRWRGEDDPVLRRTLPETYCARLTSTQARMALRQLDRVAADARTRIAYARAYHDGLQGLPGLILPPQCEDFSHIYLAYPIQIADRHALLRDLMIHGRDLTVQHIGNAADYACFSEWYRDCPNARATADQVLLLPTYPGYGMAEVQRTIRAIRAALSRVPRAALASS